MSSQAAAGGSLLVTWTGQTGVSSLPAGDSGTATRLHLLVVDHLAGVGVVAVGWLADPLARIARILVETAAGTILDLNADALLLTGQHRNDGFGAPAELTVRYGFVLLVPSPSNAQTGGGQAEGLRLRLHGAAGQTQDCFVPLVGNIGQLGDILDAVPLDYALRVIEHIFNARQSRGFQSRRLVALAERIHRRIDPQRDYGVARGGVKPECYVDGAIRVGTAGIVVRGWVLHDATDSVKRIALVSLLGRRVALDLPLPAIARPDVVEAKLEEFANAEDNCGYVAFAAIDGLERADTLWFIELVTENGAINRVPFVCPPEPAPLHGIEATVMLAEAGAQNRADLFERAISPAVEWFWAKARGLGSTVAEVAYGSPPTDARVSVIVPIYGRIDFVRHQMAAFSNDPEFRAIGGMVDLIYVLDDPTNTEEFNRLCQMLHGVYGVPFRTLLHSRNCGYSAANNAGAAAARGSLLLLLNSDVMPKKVRWVGELVRNYDTLERCGVLGCRLLFEDGSIQHAGMSFRRSPIVQGCWVNDHPGKGLSVAFDPTGSAAPVAAVTGACLMIERALFDQVGGMSEEYVIGDFEDSDLCLKVHERGFRVYYTPEVELYHLERQSMQLIGRNHAGWRQGLTLYNMWKHSRRWEALLQAIAG